MQRTFLQSIIVILALASCSRTQDKSKEKAVVEFNQDLVDELSSMAETDQIAARNAYPPEDYQHLDLEQWKDFKDSIYRTHKTRLAEIFEEYGYPGFDLVGKTGEKHFWLMVQHADFDPEFQSDVLKDLESEVKNNNADGRNFGLLTDRVRLNTGKKQIYGTQVTYISKTGQAIPKPLMDSIKVNKRRKEVGLEPIEEYLNVMTTMHFEMNKENMLKRGIVEPKLYQLPSE
ncbi:MAG: hypothetical protein JXQ90_23000 [Cyclobacteriaceae bacterium]